MSGRAPRARRLPRAPSLLGPLLGSGCCGRPTATRGLAALPPAGGGQRPLGHPLRRPARGGPPWLLSRSRCLAASASQCCHGQAQVLPLPRFGLPVVGAAGVAGRLSSASGMTSSSSGWVTTKAAVSRTGTATATPRSSCWFTSSWCGRRCVSPNAARPDRAPDLPAGERGPASHRFTGRPHPCHRGLPTGAQRGRPTSSHPTPAEVLRVPVPTPTSFVALLRHPQFDLPDVLTEPG